MQSCSLRCGSLPAGLTLHIAGASWGIFGKPTRFQSADQGVASTACCPGAGPRPTSCGVGGKLNANCGSAPASSAGAQGLGQAARRLAYSPCEKSELRNAGVEWRTESASRATSRRPGRTGPGMVSAPRTGHTFGNWANFSKISYPAGARVDGLLRGVHLAHDPPCRKALASCQCGRLPLVTSFMWICRGTWLCNHHCTHAYRMAQAIQL